MVSNTLWRRILQLFVFIAAVALLIWLLSRVGWANLTHALAQVTLGSALLVLMTGFTENFFDGLALRAAIGRPRWLQRLLSVNGLGSLINMVIPWDVGELAKAAMLRQHPGGVSGVIVWNYLYKLSRPAVALTAAIVGWALHGHQDVRITYAVIIANALGFLPYLLLKLLIHQGLAKRVLQIFDRIGLLRSRRVEWLAKATSLDASIKDMWSTRKRDYLVTLLSQMCARLASWASYLAICKSLGLGYSFGTVALIFAGLNVTELLLMVLPTKIGVTEGAAFALFGAVGLSKEAAVFIYILQRFKAVVSNGAAALLAFTSRS